MNIWAFLFYTVIVHSLSSLMGQHHEEGKDNKTFTELILLFIFIVLFIYMGWYQ